MKVKLTVVILTKNEAIHIQRVIKNVHGWADHVIVLDSYSDDETVQLAKEAGATIIYRKFDNYKNQRCFAISHCAQLTEWMLFLDADEYLTDALKNEIKPALNDKTVAGYYMPRRVIFMGKWIKHGGYYPCYLLRLFQPTLASLDREINEHVKVSGVVKKLRHDFIDHNLNGIHFWVDKHNKYSSCEAESLFQYKFNRKKTVRFKTLSLSTQVDRKKWLRENVWNRLPLLARPFLYFIYRYVLRMGFLDGKAGFRFIFLQGCWYWFIIDMKCLEKLESAKLITIAEE